MPEPADAQAPQTSSTPSTSAPKTNGTAESVRPIPGSEIIGRGIYLKPRLPFALKVSLLPPDTDEKDCYYSADTKLTYSLPRGVAVNNSPPIPATQAVNRLIIEESFERLEKELRVDTNVASSNASFSVNLNASRASQLRSNEEAIYALRNSFVPLYTVYIADVSCLKDKIKNDPLLAKITGRFDHERRAIYQQFFEKYGTHYVKGVWVGGSATLAYTVRKSSGMSTVDIQMGIQASLGIGTSTNNSKLTDAKANLQSKAECSVWGIGGDAMKLAALSSPDEKAYNDWLVSVMQNPEVIEIEVAGIWTLVDTL